MNLTKLTLSLSFLFSLAAQAQPLCSSIASSSGASSRAEDIKVRILAPSRNNELATIVYTGFTHEELYNAYLFQNISEVIDISSTNSWLQMTPTGPVKTVKALTPFGVEATMTIHGRGGSSAAKTIETDIEIKAADFSQLGLPNLVGTFCNGLATCMGLKNFVIRAKVRQVFYQRLDEGGGMAEDWIVAPKLFAVLGGREIPVPTVANLALHHIVNQVLPWTDARGVRNFGKIIQDMQRNTATIITLQQTMKPDDKNQRGIGAFTLTNKNFIPGYTLEDVKAILPLISITGRYGVAGSEFADENGNSVQEQTLSSGKSKISGGSPKLMARAAHRFIKTDVSLDKTPSPEAGSTSVTMIHNQDMAGIVGNGYLEVREFTFNGQSGILLTEIGRYAFQGTGLIRAFTTAADALGFGGAPMSQIYTVVHNIAYHPEAVGNALHDMRKGANQVPYSQFERP